MHVEIGTWCKENRVSDSRYYMSVLCLLLAPVLQIMPVHAEPDSGIVTIESITPYFAKYEVRRAGIKIAEAAYALWKDGDEYVFETSGDAKGIVKLFGKKVATETARFSLENGEIVQQHYAYEFENGEDSRNRRIDFDWDNNKVKVVRRGKVRELELRKGMVDRLLLQLVVMTDLASGKMKKEYVAVGKRSPNIYSFEKIKEELIITPAGSYKTQLISGLQKRKKGDRLTRYWCAPELAWLPVKIEQYRNGEGPFVMKLINVRGLGQEEGTN